MRVDAKDLNIIYLVKNAMLKEYIEELKRRNELEYLTELAKLEADEVRLLEEEDPDYEEPDMSGADGPNSGER